MFLNAIGLRKFMPCRPASSSRMRKAVAGAVACALLTALSLDARVEQAFKGEITDSKCAALGGHKSMTVAGESNAQCTIACVKAGAKYVLADNGHKIIYQLSDQKKPEAFAAENVVVVGTLNDSSDTIHVDDIVRALPPKVAQARSVAIICDACPRGMSKVGRVAFEQLADWKRFAMVADPTKADLVFLFSANPYLGDYLTRDGPDTRRVVVDTTYMNVIDPRTGTSLWGDYDRAGSYFVSKATRDLIADLREQLEMDSNPAEQQAFLNRHRVPKAEQSIGK
jgi:hypothetical protein